MLVPTCFLVFAPATFGPQPNHQASRNVEEISPHFRMIPRMNALPGCFLQSLVRNSHNCVWAYSCTVKAETRKSVSCMRFTVIFQSSQLLYHYHRVKTCRSLCHSFYMIMRPQLQPSTLAMPVSHGITSCSAEGVGNDPLLNDFNLVMPEGLKGARCCAFCAHHMRGVVAGSRISATVLSPPFPSASGVRADVTHGVTERYIILLQWYG